MNPLSANLSAFRNIVNFKSRAPRSEYWWVFATLIGGVVFAAMVDNQLFPEGGEGSALYSALNFIFILFYVPLLLAVISVTIRRLNDLDLSGWWACLYFLPLGLGFVFMGFICAKKGTPGPNRFGNDPHYVDVFSDVDEFG
ncbi:MAG: DUF805 domain-containing protein [Litorimonas sp.]